MTTTLYVKQDGRDFYCLDPVSKETVEVWTARDSRQGDTIENAMAWRDMFVAHHVNRGFAPRFAPDFKNEMVFGTADMYDRLWQS